MIGLENEAEADRALEELTSSDDLSADGVLRCANGQLMLATMRGEIREPLERLQATLPLIEKTRDPMIQSSALNSYAATLVLSGRYEEAQKVARTELEVADEYRLAFVRPHALLYHAGALWGLRQFKRSISMLDEVARTCSGDQFVLMNVGAVLARIYLALGSPERALRVLEEHLGQESTPGMEAEYNAWWGVVLASMGGTDDAQAHASAAAASSCRTEVAGLVPWISAIANIRNSASNTRASILDAYRMSHATGNVDGFVAAYRTAREILSVVADDKAQHRDLRLILSRANDHAFGRSLGLHVPGGTIGTTAELSRREEDVLDLLVRGATNREMARALFISEATVKVHLRHIYAKMGVRSRTEAVVQALERGASD